MDGRERRRQVIRVISKIFLILGGILLGIVGLYAMFLYPSPNRIRRSGRRDYIGTVYNLLQDILELSRYEPLGGILALISVSLLLIGILLNVISHHFI